MSFEDFSSEQPPEGSSVEDAPPDEVLEEMRLAAEIHQRLADRGRELRFRLDPPTGKVTVGVHDDAGKLLYTIPPSRALEIAGGEDLDAV